MLIKELNFILKKYLLKESVHILHLELLIRKLGILVLVLWIENNKEKINLFILFVMILVQVILKILILLKMLNKLNGEK